MKKDRHVNVVPGNDSLTMLFKPFMSSYCVQVDPTLCTYLQSQAILDLLTAVFLACGSVFPDESGGRH